MSGQDHEFFREWDAAYILGALTAEDRRAFEGHLETCEQCRAAVGELAPMPGLLARIRPQSQPIARAEPAETEIDSVADADGEGTGADADGAGTGAGADGATSDAGADGASSPDRKKVADAAPDRRRPVRRRLLVVAAIAAVVALVLAFVIPTALLDRNGTTEPTESVTVALTPVDDAEVRMSVEVGLESVAWGTRLRIECEYPPGGAYSGAAPVYGLILTDDTGATRDVSTWSAVPGRTIGLEASTSLRLEDISDLTVVSSTGTPLLAATLPASAG